MLLTRINFYCAVVVIKTNSATWLNINMTVTPQSYSSRTYGQCKKWWCFETRRKFKKTSFQPLNDAQDEIKISKSLLHINRTTKNIFLKMIILLLKMYEEFKEPGFCKKKKLPNVWPSGLPANFLTFFTKHYDTKNQTPRYQFACS